ncbi:uncharacterized protein FIBRA_05781 [Fibroporia radiculosa]|uniref:BHLH domain-containing protein n=1 Tax=Fibroporia radiculosa TaxID=599839 RepID=J4HY34_9APHY|nr:uncharacterized protein FIBRA_05781 [Fibroporia radiculosa]CCM03637.1 predicted protein [Fibroporia radiculosa]
MDSHPVPPPGAFDDSQFFNPAFQHSLFPSPPPLPASADLFSPSETTDFLGFLDNFNWELDFDSHNAPYPTPFSHLGPLAEDGHPNPQPSAHQQLDPRLSAPSASPSGSSSSAQAPPDPASAVPPGLRPKPLLSTPQKRLNHIMSEQKRRNAIRDGYLQLTTLLAPAGAPPGSGMPTRGRPKGSGGQSRGNKGKSGILFKAREYIRFLEEGNDALQQELMKVEAAAEAQH